MTYVHIICLKVISCEFVTAVLHQLLTLNRQIVQNVCFFSKSGHRIPQTIMSDSNFTDCFSKVLEPSTWLLLFIFSLDFSTFPTFPLLAFYAFSLLFLFAFPVLSRHLRFLFPYLPPANYVIRCVIEARLLPDPGV